LNLSLHRQGYPVGERKQMVATQMLADAQRAEAAEAARVASISPFERQMERVRNGARLIEKPVFRRADPSYTLGGVSAGML
jgi:hypothetical protein